MVFVYFIIDFFSELLFFPRYRERQNDWCFARSLIKSLYRLPACRFILFSFLAGICTVTAQHKHTENTVKMY